MRTALMRMPLTSIVVTIGIGITATGTERCPKSSWMVCLIDAAESEGCRVRLAARASDSAILLFWKGAGRTICGS